MKPFIKTIFMVTMGASVLTSCLKDKDDDEPFVYPTQQEITTKIVGKWKSIMLDGYYLPTNMREVRTFTADKTGQVSMTMNVMGKLHYSRKADFVYDIVNYNFNMKSDDPVEVPSTSGEVQVVNGSVLITKISQVTDGVTTNEVNNQFAYIKIKTDYAAAVVGLWQGIAKSADVKGDTPSHVRVEYRADGSYTLYSLANDKWLANPTIDNEYVVDGDWLSYRSRKDADTDFVYEAWDIDTIKADTMYWSALRYAVSGYEPWTSRYVWKRIKAED